MRKVTLGEVLKVKRGASLSGEYYAIEGSLIRLTLGNFKYPGGGFKENTAKDDIYYNGPVRPEFILCKGDIITPLTEQVVGLLGETATIPESGKYIQSGDVGLIIPDETQLDRRFAYYLLSSPIVKKQLSAGAQQTKIRHTSPDAIKACKAWIPEDITVQKSIGELLDNINNKIYNNNAICADLESMAKLLYDYWFVQFDFPDEKGKPYKSSGGEMVWNTALKMEIPEGWNAIHLENIAEIAYEGALPRAGTVYTHYSIPAFDDNGLPVMEDGGEINSNKYVVPPHSVLVSKLNPQFKRLWDIDDPGDNAVCSTEFMPFVSKDDHKELMYSLLNSDSFYVFMVQSSSSSTGSRKRMDPELCKKFLLAYPEDISVVDLFCDKICPVLEKLRQLRKENKELMELRDFLLPMLMNGQVKVRPLEENM